MLFFVRLYAKLTYKLARQISEQVRHGRVKNVNWKFVEDLCKPIILYPAFAMKEYLNRN